MGLNGMDQRLGITPFAKEAQLGAWMAIFQIIHIRMALVIEIVEQTGDAPQLLIFLKMAGIGTQRSFHG